MSNHELKQVNLNSNILHVACNTSTGTVDPHGILAIKGEYWVANAGSDTIYYLSDKGRLKFIITTINSPLGLVRNRSKTAFGGYRLLISTAAGTVEGYNKNVSLNTTVATPITLANGYFPSLALYKYSRLYIANFADTSFSGANVRVYDSAFTLLTTFTDPALVTAGYAPYSLAVYGKHVYVGFARRDANIAVNDPVACLNCGYIDKFRLDGTHLKRIVNGTGLNIPSAIVFSECGKYMYVANKGDGTISVFDKCGKYLTQIKDCHCNILYIDGITGLDFSCNKFAFTAALDDGENGLVGALICCGEKFSCSSSSSSSSDC